MSAALCALQSLFLALLLIQGAAPQGNSSVLYGSWTATAGPAQVFRGSWSAEISPGTPNQAQGSWTLTNDSGDVVLQGTWSARKAAGRWQGTWHARTAQGQTFAGTWDAAITDAKNRTFADLLRQTLKKEVSGSWQSGRYQGNWWLKGFIPKGGTR